MAVLQIPTRTDLSRYTETVELDGLTYQLTFRWNTRMEAWFMDIAREDGTLIAGGLRCVVGSPLNGQLHHLTDAPPGNLVAYDTTRRDIDPALADFGTRVVLLYFTADEAV